MCQSEVSLWSVIRISLVSMFRSVALAQALAQKRLSKVSVTKSLASVALNNFLEVSVERSARSSKASLKIWLQLDSVARVDEIHIPKAIFCIRVRGFYQVSEMGGHKKLSKTWTSKW